MGSSRVNVRMYVLGLLKFEDDSVVIKDDLLKKYSSAIGSLPDRFRGKATDPNAGAEWHVFHIEPTSVTECIEKSIQGPTGKSFELLDARLGYYHHRFIVDFRLRCPKEARGEIRRLRSSLMDFSKALIDECVGEMSKCSEKPKIWDFFTYPLVLVTNNGTASRPEDMPFSLETTSLCFDINEPKWLGFRSEKHMIRISIPGMFLFGNLEPRRESPLIRDLINACYQYGLYNLKDRYPETPPAKRGGGEKFQVFIEKDLVNLWTHIIDTMGGKSIDVRVARMAQMTLVVCSVTLVVSFFMFLYPFLSPMLERAISGK